MFRKAILLVAWFPLTAVLIVHNILFLAKAPGRLLIQADEPVFATPIADTHPVAAADKGTGQVLAADIIAGDGRALLLSEFLRGSPMAPYAEYIVSEADRYGLDYRLVPAIAMCESNLGIRIPTSDSYNAWGIAVYTGQQEGAKFNSWPAAISWVNDFLYQKFVSRNIIDIREIGAIWAPPSVEKGDSWANCVETFMRSIQ